VAAPEPFGVDDLPDFKGKALVNLGIETGISPYADGSPAFFNTQAQTRTQLLRFSA
jgi:hypothetical protein